MSKFKKLPKTAEDFIEGADQINAAPVKPRPSRKKPWDGMNPKAASKNVFNLRLNDYYWTMLRHLAEKTDKPLQQVVKESLLPELEKKANKC